MTTDLGSFILVVDDDKDYLEIINAKLTAQGLEVITATDGSDAVEKARQYKPAVILMDVEMPGKDGMTAAAELALSPETKDIPVIFVTNLAPDTIKALALKISLHISAQNYFRKEDDYGILMNKISAYAVAR